MTAEAATSAGKAVGAAGIVVLSCWFAGRAVVGRAGSVRSSLTRLELKLFSASQYKMVFDISQSDPEVVITVFERDGRDRRVGKRLPATRRRPP